MAGTLSVQKIQGLATSATPTTVEVSTGHKLYAPGHVIQVQSALKTDHFSSTSTSFVDVGVACNITPSSTSSTILIPAGVGEPDELDGRVRAHVFRDSTDLGSSSTYAYRGAITAELGRNLGHSGTEDHFGTFSKSFIDSPATTSQITYSVKIASGTGSSIRIGNGTSSYVVAMEILA